MAITSTSSIGLELGKCLITAILKDYGIKPVKSIELIISTTVRGLIAGTISLSSLVRMWSKRHNDGLDFFEGNYS